MGSLRRWLGTEADLIGAFASVGFVTADPAMVPLLHKAWRAARVSDATLLVEGETGTGKQVLANAIHNLDAKRSGNPFVTLHCGSIPEMLAEAEIFGHTRGAFSGAVQERKGLIQTAHKGTLFLDDINDLAMPLQIKLLDFLQRGKVRAVGSDLESTVDVRIIAAANQPLSPLVREAKFREDLYYRLDVIRFSLPPLRQRPRDIAALLLAFAQRHESLYPGIESVDHDLERHLQSLAFSGNVRELEHAVQRMLFAKLEGSSLTLSDWLEQTHDADREVGNDIEALAASVRKLIGKRSSTFEATFRELEKRVLEGVLKEGGTRKQVAGMLGISERNLYHKMRAHRLGRTAKNGSDEDENRSSLRDCGTGA